MMAPIIDNTIITNNVPISFNGLVVIFGFITTTSLVVGQMTFQEKAIDTVPYIGTMGVFNELLISAS
ncbi:hypothetical protein D3C73_1619720 [compost metagenome]